MITVCPHCKESVSVYFDEKKLGNALVSVWHYSRPEAHRWKLDKEASASLQSASLSSGPRPVAPG